MKELALLGPALGAVARGPSHELWWLVLAVVVIALVTPLGYMWGSQRGRPRRA